MITLTGYVAELFIDGISCCRPFDFLTGTTSRYSPVDILAGTVNLFCLVDIVTGTTSRYCHVDVLTNPSSCYCYGLQLAVSVGTVLLTY
jgi:hypothetical protein